MMEGDLDTDPNIFVGPTWESCRPGSPRFKSLVQSLATSTGRVGAATRYDAFMFRDLSPDLLAARQKIDDAHKLLLGAHALLRAADADARMTAQVVAASMVVA